MKKLFIPLLAFDFILLVISVILWRYNDTDTSYRHPSLPAGTQTAWYVAPDGNDANPGTIDRPFGSLYKARDAVRMNNTAMTGDIIVYLRGGIYSLDSAFKLTDMDKGSNGHSIIYKAYNCEPVTISGGLPVTGWSLYDGGRNIYRAYAVAHSDSRQLYINGRRATRARSKDASGWTENGDGYDCPASVAQWKDIQRVEVVSYRNWKSHRGPVASVSGTHAVMAKPYWTLLHQQYDAPAVWIENAYELLDEEGEWWLDTTHDSIYYKPMAGENLAASEVILPRLEILIQGSNVANVQFNGLTFSYATWLRPNTNHGFPCLQTDALYNDESESPLQLPGNLNFDHSTQIRFEGNKFEHLGADGLRLYKGCRYNYVYNNDFRDISGTAISIGSFADPNPPATDLVKDNTIENNSITGAVEYKSCTGIFAGYTDHTVITHNHLRNLSYSGMSVGWGWSNSPTVAKNNEISYNRIDSVMTELFDGGAIYTLSDQPGTKVHDNYIHTQIHEYGSLYPDEGSSHMHWYRNVVQDETRWLHMWTPSISYDTVDFNYYDNATSTINGDHCVIENNFFVSGGNWPTEAIAIMNNAGIPGESFTQTSVKSICVNPASIVLQPGENFTLTATLLPPDAAVQQVNWSSDNNVIVTVSNNGVITAHSRGSATITARTLDRNLPASCTVLVTNFRKPWPKYFFVSFLIVGLLAALAYFRKL